MFQRIWQWLKQLWQRWVARQPPPAPTRQPPSDAECESVFMELLQEVASGSTRGEIQGFLIIQQGKKHVTEADLVAWLRRTSDSWLASPAQHQELGRRMGRLGDIYKGEIAEVARDIGRQLVVENKLSVQYPSNHTSTTLTNNPSIPSNHTSTTPTNQPSVSSNHKSIILINQPSVTHPPTINPEAATLHNQGVDLAYAGNVLGALALFERAVAIDPNFHFAWNRLGIALNNLQRYDEAIAAYERAVAIDPNNRFAWYGLGNALNDVQRYDEAIEKFDRALQITKDQFWQAWFNRGWAFFESHRYDLAIQNWDDGINKYLPANPDWKVAQGRLYQAKGRAQYLHGRQTTQYFPYFLEAKTSYQKALEFLDRPNQLRLGVLQEAIPVFRALNDATASKYLTQQGIEILQDLISAASSPAHKLRLQRKFSSFYQLEVDNLVQSGNFPLALTKAEKRKNYCLRWLREGRIENLEDSPTCEQIHQLLNPGTAIIYWHISPAAITTFILGQNQPLHAQIFTEDLTSIGADKELYKFETWLKEWKTDYQSYCEILKTEGTEKKSEAPIFKQGLGDIPSQENHPWRAKMPERLNQLAEILHIRQILTAVGNNITQIILIPHRDLHLLPLESLFYQTLEANDNLPAITRLPSAQIGINLQPLQLTAEKQLLNVFGSADELWFPEMEFALIAQLYHPHLTSIPSHNATKQQITAAIPAGTNCFHFTGHGYHNLDSPTESALELTNQERLTLQEIFKLNFQGYHLVSLSACETGITSKQGIIDEYVGLVSGFLAGGVARVVSTLWRVDEFSAALMMIKFHQLFKDGIPPAEALQQAQHWLRTITYSELAQWYRHRAAELQSPYLVSKQKLESLARNIENSARINSDQPPFAHPCFWSGFTITGKINNT